VLSPDCSLRADCIVIVTDAIILIALIADGLAGSEAFENEIDWNRVTELRVAFNLKPGELTIQDVDSRLVQCVEGVIAELFPCASGWRLVWPASRLRCPCMARTYADERDRTCLAVKV
jgi:hypothetical protein